MTQLQFQPVGGPSPDDLEITSVDSYVVRVPADAPKHELAGQSIPVDGQSLAMSDLYMSTCIFFSSDADPSLKGRTLADVKVALDQGLERLVAQFPAASSNFGKGEDDIWHINYTDHGIPVELATSPRALGRGYIGAGGRVDHNVCARNFYVADHAHPGLVIKVTRFACGSVAIGTSTHHWIVDFAGYYDMMALLAKAMSQPHEDLPYRNHTRDIVKLVANVPSEPFPADEWYIENGGGVWDKRDFKLAPSNVTNRMVYISRDKLEQLKFDTVRSSQTLPVDERPSKFSWISTNDAIAALLWSSVTAARRISDAEGGDSRIVLTVDGRRYVPGGDSYVGNVHTMHTTAVPLSVLNSQSVSGVLKVAHRLRDDLNQLSDGKMAAIIRLQGEDLRKRFMPNYKPFFGHDVLISNLTKYDWTGLTFGALGSPVYTTIVSTAPIQAGSLVIEGSDGTVFIQSAPQGFTPEGSAEKSGEATAPASKVADDWSAGAKPGVIALVGLRSCDVEAFESLPLVKRYAVVLP